MTSWNRMTSSPEKESPIHRRGRIAFCMLVALLVGLAATAALYIGKVPADLRGIRVERDEDVVFTQKAGKMLSDDRKADPESIQSDDSKQTVRTYEWIDHNGGTISLKLSINDDVYDYYSSLPRFYSPFDYYHYVDDPYSQAYAKHVIDSIKKMDWQYGYSNYDTVLHVIEFVQNLDYIEDVDTNGKQIEYPKYPVETLRDKCGDCEDTAILLAALLKELGYDCIFIKFDEHIGVGVYGDESLEGSYYELGDKRYYYVYVETTKPNWDIGDFPNDLSSTATLIKIP